MKPQDQEELDKDLAELLAKIRERKAGAAARAEIRKKLKKWLPDPENMTEAQKRVIVHESNHRPDREICDIFGVSLKTLQEWKRLYDPEVDAVLKEIRKRKNKQFNKQPRRLPNARDMNEAQKKLIVSESNKIDHQKICEVYNIGRRTLQRWRAKYN